MVTKIQIKVRKRMDCTTTVRRTIALVDDITLRCNHATSHVEWNVGTPQGIEIASANEFHEFRSLNPSAASIFSKIWVIPKFSVQGPGGVDSYNFLVSQRLTVILAGNLLETRADQTI